MMDFKDVDPKIKRLFPWALFLVLAALLFFMAGRVHAEEDVWACYGGQRYEAMSSGFPQCNELGHLCTRVTEYLKTHTKEEGREEAKRRNLPQWLINRAERCIP